MTDKIDDATVEAVARAFCRRMGLDPDEPWNMSRENLNWHMKRSQAREAIAMRLSIEEVMG